MTRFPDTPTYTGPNTPQRIEGEIYDLEVTQGEVPEQLDGTFYRVQGEPQWPPKLGDDFPFNWDGMVSMFRFSRGHVDFKCRYVRTPRFLAERTARRALFGAYRNPYTDDPSVAGVNRGLANTNVYWHAGKLLASKEDSPPILIDPDTLDTVGQFTFEGAMTSLTATAHPKIDPRTGELVFFGFAAKGETTRDIAYYEADRDGNVIHEAWIEAPYSSMVHDWAVTQNFVVFPVIPLRSDLERLKAGEPHYAWDPDEDVYLGVMPRKGDPGSVRWFRGANRFASHVMNAFDDGRRIHLDTPVGTTSAFPWFPDLSGKPFDPSETAAQLSRWTIDTGADPDGGFAETRLTSHSGEFPRMDDRWETLPYSYGVMGLTDVAGERRPGVGFRWVGAIDHRTGRMDTHWVGPESTASEPVFVPGDDRAGEGEGYVFLLVTRQADLRCDLLILDARDVGGAPVATLGLPIKLGYGLHGNWVTAEELARRVT